MKRTLCLYLLTTAIPGLAQAQDISFSGAVTAGLGFHDVSDISQGLNTASIDGRLDLDFGNGFSLGIDAGYLNVDIDDVPFDVAADFMALDGTYRFANGLSLGLYHERLSAEADDILPIDISLESTGVAGGYDMEGLSFGAFFGESDTSPALGTDVDIKDFGLTVKYSGTTNLNLGAAFLRTTVDSAGTEVDIDFRGAAATYALNEQFMVFGGLSQTSIDFIDADATTIGLGLGYALPEMGGVNSTLSLELARSDLSVSGTDVGDLDTVRLGFTVPLGGKGSESPLNSVADSIFNPRHSAINAGLTSAF
jgi:hypothetical protein